jgi:rod shape-determining protein MreC
MALSRRSSRTGRSRFTLLLLVLTSITVLTLDFRGSGVVEDVRGGAATVFGPLRDAGAWVGSPVADAWNGVFSYGDLEAENEDLRERIAELEGEMAQSEDALEQLDEIDRLEGIRRWTDEESVVARVTGSSLSNFEQTVELDKGSDQGISVGMPVVTGAGLVGRVVQVTGSRSAVQLVTDPTFDFGVRLSGSDEVAIAHGTGEGEPLAVEEGIPVNVEVNERQLVTTSGGDRGILPQDIPVGRVLSVTTSADQLHRVLEVRLLADLDDLSYVRVIRWTPAGS